MLVPIRARRVTQKAEQSYLLLELKEGGAQNSKFQGCSVSQLNAKATKFSLRSSVWREFVPLRFIPASV